MSYILNLNLNYGAILMDLFNRHPQKNAQIAYRIIEGEALIVNPKDSLIYPLNAVGTRIWELLNGQKTCEEIINIIDAEFQGDKIDMRQDILSFIEELINKGLAEGVYSKGNKYSNGNK